MAGFYPACIRQSAVSSAILIYAIVPHRSWNV